MNLLLAHLVGDYVFQNRWMATHKATLTHKGSLALLIHCLIYTLAVYAFTGWSIGLLWMVFCTHGIMDGAGVAKAWRKFFSKDEEVPWIITTDNTVHLLILWALSSVT